LKTIVDGITTTHLFSQLHSFQIHYALSNTSR